MGSKILFNVINSDRSAEEIVAAIQKSAMLLGGQVIRLNDTTLRIVNGKEGVQFGFSADFEATININPKPENRYEVISNVSWKMNTLSWVCFIVGFFVFGILWIIPLLHLFIDPSKNYNNIIFMAANQIGAQFTPTIY